MRYLVRLANSYNYLPKDVKKVQTKIRELLGSADKIGNLRISSTAVEFDLFADPADLDRSNGLLEANISKVVTLRPIDSRVPTRKDDEALREGVELFNQERFWEAHEVLEEIWHPATGVERDVIQGLILTAAAFVHYQKDETVVCLSILARARKKLAALDNFGGLDIKRQRASIEQILKNDSPKLFHLQRVDTKISPSSS
jgi:uncharacterized protein